MTGDETPEAPAGEGGTVEVERTGIALVHKDERIVAAERSKAWLRPDDDRVVHYYFPVEIEVVGHGGLDALWEKLADELRKEFETFS
jgi:hypothetical protein